MIKVKNISVAIEDKNILSNISLDFELGKNYCILGKNWSGKSTLATTIMWNPKYKITQWDVLLNNISIKDMSPDKRAKEWIFLAFQTIPEIKWIKLFEFLRSIYNAKFETNLTFLKFKEVLLPLLAELSIDKEFLWRDLNVGFSGGEKRKIEILQLKLLKPKYIFLDEIDSWLDVDAFRSVANLIKSIDNKENSLIVITHYFTILDYVNIDRVYVLNKWILEIQWDKTIAENIKNNWFEKL